MIFQLELPDDKAGIYLPLLIEQYGLDTEGMSQQGVAGAVVEAIRSEIIQGLNAILIERAGAEARESMRTELEDTVV